ncbi:hypothetical protein BD289DRAFT_484378 [Coniella lustricola]|uniref:PD-(D/E)XK nuclease-like domain-containing protein n=1 Tax=Coniella lustricola TaxID=2025994 RepID=A0A2T3A239_9PEZI|nr:hypothetical protein BD289DRAFT_484378 [Coniella lustricola]
MSRVSQRFGIISASRIAEMQADVEQVLFWASELSGTGAEEAAWHSAVYHQLLKLSIYKDGRPRKDLVGFSQCTSAATVPQYRTSDTPTKKVDFCIHIDPEFDLGTQHNAAAARVRALCQTLSQQTINATDCEPLCGRPIAVSLESKKPDAGKSADAQLQIAMWHAAQWRMLELLLERQASAT